MPAGTYMASKPNINSGVLWIRDANWSHSAFVLYNPTQSTEPVAHGKVTFRQYDDADYLSGFILAGEITGVEIPESLAEKKAASTKHTVASTKSVALQLGGFGY
jgi:hypothetical protein